VLARKIFIAWKESEGSRRFIIAKIKRNKSEGITFEYCDEGFEGAQKRGLEFFFGFKNAPELSPNQVEQLLVQRVISKERPDRKEFLSFWEAAEVNDTFDILALTQGKSPTDNFEFLAVYYPKRGLHFVTDLAGISHLDLPRGCVQKDDILSFKKEPDNEYDSHAIALFKGSMKVGYVKKIHNQVFLQEGTPTPELKVKGVDQNGRIKQIFVSVHYK
jgi:hypothetical protein